MSRATGSFTCGILSHRFAMENMALMVSRGYECLAWHRLKHGLHGRLMNIRYKSQRVMSLGFSLVMVRTMNRPGGLLGPPSSCQSHFHCYPTRHIWCDVVHSHLPIPLLLNLGKATETRQATYSHGVTRTGPRSIYVEDAHYHLLLQHLH
jgi:hypothetical protein